MRKYVFFIAAALTAVIEVSCASGLSTTSTPAQKALAATLQATELVDQAVLSADAAVRANTLRGTAAAQTVIGLKAARDGLKIATVAQQVAASAAQPASAP